MKEEVLQAILRDRNIYWWEAIGSRRVFRMSEELGGMFGVSGSEIGEEHLMQSCPDVCRWLRQPTTDAGCTYRTTFTAAEGPVEITWKVLLHERFADGSLRMAGSADVRAASESESENVLLRRAYDCIRDGVEIYDREGNLVDMNARNLEMLNISDADILRRTNFFENALMPEEIRQKVRAALDRGWHDEYSFERTCSYHASGENVCMRMLTTITPLRDDRGNVTHFMLVNRDICETARVHAESENLFSLISRFGKVGYCLFDSATFEGFGSSQWYRNLGEEQTTPLNRIIGVYSHIDGEDRESIKNAIVRLGEKKIDTFTLDVRIDSGLEEQWTRIFLIRNPMNEAYGKQELICVNFDISELKQTERNLLKAKNKAEVSDQLKSAFLANMSHEIRTPLNAIVGFSSLLTEAEDEDERREYMEVVNENNELLLKLISDILDLSKIEAGTFDFDYSQVDVNQMCEEAVKTLGLKAQDRAIDLRFDAPPTACTILGDKNRLMQVITNFINNALKFTAEGSITLSCEPHSREVLFSVEDTGTGIDKEHLPLVFDRFVKLNSCVQGTGLGLSICKSIVEQMGGRIGVESVLGKGSRFWFTVPIEGRAGAVAERADHSSCGGHPQVAQKGKLPRLLVAEDIDSNFLLVSLMLKKEYEVVRARNGLEAVRLCAEIHPDAILMDIWMPEMDGLEATRQIRRTNPDLPILAVTAFAYDRDRQRAFDAGCDDYLTKPLVGNVLRQRLRTLINR